MFTMLANIEKVLDDSVVDVRILYVVDHKDS